ncbi:MAG: hypothetical protein IJ449_09915 [Clostridia bacterium]|nr:hypothetical protein [Clostridia bacterium]
MNPETLMLLVIVFIVGGFTLREILFLVRSCSCTEYGYGTVEQLSECGRGRGGSYFRARITYEYNGETYEAEVFHTYRYDTHPVGSEVALFIDPGQPEHCILQSERQDAGKRIALGAALTVALAVLTIWK